MEIMEKLDLINVSKYGTAVLTEQDGSIATDLMADHGNIWRNTAEAVCLVTSGAVGFGKDKTNFSYVDSKVMQKRAQAGHGNISLFKNWQTAISPQRKKVIIQALTTHRNFEPDRQSRSELLAFLAAIYQKPDYPIFTLNENDVLSDQELKSARGGDIGDNDENAARLAVLCTELAESVRLTINTNEDGVWESAKTKKIIPMLSAQEDLTDKFITDRCGDVTSQEGTGGMSGKLTHIRNALLDKQSQGEIIAWIINGKNPKMLEQVLTGEPQGTKIIKSHNLGQI